MARVRPNTARAHIDRARFLIETVHSQTGGSLTYDQMLAAAQIHAMLALAEATRTHNMLVMNRMMNTISDDVIGRVDD